MNRVLILGGTAEARELAHELTAAGAEVTSSLAGRVREPLLPPGDVRIGGFGGPAGLAGWLAEHDVRSVVDATHPFARRISASAVEACRRTGASLTRLERPSWEELPGDRWLRVHDVAAAAAAVPGRGERVLLTTGRLEAAAFAAVSEAWFLIRAIGEPEGPLPPRHDLLLERGPFGLEGERALLDRHRIDLVVTKDSGGERRAPKLEAARERGVPVIVVQRPPGPAAPTVSTVPDALRRLEGLP